MIKISDNSISPTFETNAIDEFNQVRNVHIAIERALIIYIDGKEIVTLMTLGSYPEALVLGYLRNQRLILSIDELVSIAVDWDKESAKVITKNGIKNLNKKIANRIVTTGCGQGTIFSCTMDDVYSVKLPNTTIKQSIIYSLLTSLNSFNKIYKSAGAVHSCALCNLDEVLIAVEDVGRHNAADTIAGLIWLKEIKEAKNLIFYTTGRVTSEIVMKVAQMNISIIISRSGITKMGLEIAQDIGLMIVARAKGKHFLVFSEQQKIIFDT